MSTNFLFSKVCWNTQQCFAFTPQANFSAHNLNFYVGKGDGIEPRPSFKIFSTLTTISRDLKIPKTNTYLCHFCLQVNEVTKNFRLIRDCFSQYFSWMTRFQHVHQQNPDDPRLSDSLPKFRRAMFTVGLLVRHFDFSKQQLYEGLPVSLF